MSTITTITHGYLVIRGGRSVHGHIRATVKVRDPVTQALSPKEARVDALEDASGRLVGSAWSDPASGAYEITGLDERVPHTVLARDPLQNMRPVAADRILPQVTP